MRRIIMVRQLSAHPPFAKKLVHVKTCLRYVVTMKCVATVGPASPIIEDVAPIRGGLNISWKSDVTSKQEKYIVIYVRNDTDIPISIETEEPRVTLQDLYPGAGYDIKVREASS